MKRSIYILTVAIVLASCGDKGEIETQDIIDSGDLAALEQRRSEISTERERINEELTAIDQAIAKKDPLKNLPLVTTIEAQPEVFNHFLELQGDVQTKQNVLIYPEMAGTLLKVYVTEGERVKKGQLLATIDDGGMGSQLEQLRTQAALAKTTFERQKRLWDQKIGSEIQYLQAKTNYEAAQNAVSGAQSQLEKSNMRAPFAGVIDDVIKDQGTVVSPGPSSEVFRIVNLSNMYVEVEVPESYLGDVSAGKEVKVYFPVLRDSVFTKVRETGNFINPSNRSFSVEIPVPNKNGKIKPNLTARVNINDYTSQDAILIPQSVISENAEGEQYAYVIDGGQADAKKIATRKIITTGRTQGAMVEVLSGIAPGDLIVKEGARSIKDGQEVEIQKT